MSILWKILGLDRELEQRADKVRAMTAAILANREANNAEGPACLSASGHRFGKWDEVSRHNLVQGPDNKKVGEVFVQERVCYQCGLKEARRDQINLIEGQN